MSVGKWLLFIVIVNGLLAAFLTWRIPLGDSFKSDVLQFFAIWLITASLNIFCAAEALGQVVPKKGGNDD